MSQDPDDLTLADIRRWYQRNGMPFYEEDWGPRDDHGESAGPQNQVQERKDLVRSSATTPDRMWWWEKQTFPWRDRTIEEKRWLYLLDDFFAPYLAMLPRQKGNLLRQVFGELRTYAEAGQEVGITKQGAQQATVRALRDLTRRIALDDPLFNPQRGPGGARDYEEEARAARRVFIVYVATQGIELDPEEEG